MSTIYDVANVKGFIRMCNDGWLQGWHERNGGNLTYRMTEEDVAACRPFFDETPREWVNMGVQADNLAGEYFITTGSGKFFRNVEPDPIHSIGIVEINDKGDSWRIVWGLADGAKPTSEFPSHFMNHSVRKAATNGANRVIYHCHATNVIALTYILPLTDRDFTRALWQSATECPVVFPEGVGVCPWMVPGGADIAMATSELMKKYQAAIWAQHGLFASGPDFDITFGLAHTIEKSAEIYVKVLSMGGGLIRQTITDDDLRAIARDFGVQLNEEFLDCFILTFSIFPYICLPVLQPSCVPEGFFVLHLLFAQTCAMLKEKQGRRYAPCSLTTAKPAPRCSRHRALARRILQRKAAFVQVKPSSASASPARTGFCRLLLCTAHRMLSIFIVLMGFLLRKERIPSRAPFDIVLSISPDIFASNA